jgi:hypothetical protein
MLAACDQSPNAATGHTANKLAVTAASSINAEATPQLNQNAARFAHWAFWMKLRELVDPVESSGPYRSDALHLLALDDSLSATEYAKAYAANEIAADNRLKGKRFVLSGVIAGINKDAAGTPFLSLSTPAGFVKANLRADQMNGAATLSRGDRPLLVCRGAGMAVSIVVADDCVSMSQYLLDNSDAQAKQVADFLHGKQALPTPVAELVVSFYALGQELPADSPCFDEPGGERCASAAKPYRTDPKLQARLDERAKQLSKLTLQNYTRD